MNPEHVLVDQAQTQIGLECAADHGLMAGHDVEG